LNSSRFFEEFTVKKVKALSPIWRAWGQKLGQTLLGGVILAFSAQSSWAQGTDDRVNIDSFGEPYTTAMAANAAQTRVYVYRSSQVPNEAPVNLYLNGQYHASLLRGGFTEFCAAAGAVNIKAAMDDAARLHLSKLDAGQRLPLTAGQTLFLKVDESKLPSLLLVSGTEAQTKSEMLNTRRQIHTISRAKAAINCDEPAPVVAKPEPKTKTQVPREYALETDALFEFGKAEIRASGFNAIEALVQRLRQDFSSVERVRVVGYTDPIGSPTFNKKLSKARADVVARQISSHNLHLERGIQAEGRGSIELVKIGCRNTPTPENKLCHAPNRRVMVVITGARR
jgi:OOP family OmpA-OmpF porin